MLKVFPISAFTDNYIWAIDKAQGATFAVVDPGDSDRRRSAVPHLEDRWPSTGVVALGR